MVPANGPEKPHGFRLGRHRACCRRRGILIGRDEKCPGHNWWVLEHEGSLEHVCMSHPTKHEALSQCRTYSESTLRSLVWKIANLGTIFHVRSYSQARLLVVFVRIFHVSHAFYSALKAEQSHFLHSAELFTCPLTSFFYIINNKWATVTAVMLLRT